MKLKQQIYRIHVVGCSPRSGTTLMTEILYNCFEIDMYNGFESNISVCPPHSGNIFLTKSPKDIVIVKDILNAMKNLYVIYLVRDPRDVIVSKHPWDKDRYWSSLKFWKLFTPFGRALRDHRRFITVRYEDLVQNPGYVNELIKERMPFLQSKAPFSNFHKIANPSAHSLDALGGLRPISEGSIGNWRNHKERVLGQILKHGPISEDLIEYGYETDNSWERELTGIQPDLKVSHPSAFDSQAFITKKLRWNKLRALRMYIGHSTLLLKLKSLFTVKNHTPAPFGTTGNNTMDSLVYSGERVTAKTSG